MKGLSPKTVRNGKAVSWGPLSVLGIPLITSPNCRCSYSTPAPH